MLDVIQSTLEMRHVCPTAPDTLRAFPYVDEDPFVMHECPHVFFAGNQPAFGSRLVHPGGMASQAVQIISVPAFRRTRSIALLDVTSLQCYEVKFDVSSGIMPQTEEMNVDA